MARPHTVKALDHTCYVVGLVFAMAADETPRVVAARLVAGTDATL